MSEPSNSIEDGPLATFGLDDRGCHEREDDHPVSLCRLKSGNALEGHCSTIQKAIILRADTQTYPNASLPGLTEPPPGFEKNSSQSVIMSQTLRRDPTPMLVT